MMNAPTHDLGHWGERLPRVSCLCPTYGRPHLIGEAIESFLRQDYPGEKELIVLNDHPEMPLSGEWPGVTIVNLTERCGSLGEKRNKLAALATGDVFLPWDDDDICLPHRISATLARMRNHHYFKPTDLWWWTGGGADFHEGAMAHAMAGYSRELFDSCGGYPLIDSGEDQGFDHCVKRLGLWDSGALGRADAFYIYRRNHVKTYHVSGYGFGGGWDECAAHVAETIEPGVKAITAEWTLPYDRIITRHIAERAALLTPRPGEPLLSVCVSVKNRSRVPHAGGTLDLFPRCVASLAKAAETLGPIELVVADFGSDDHPLEQWLQEAGRGLRLKLIHVEGPFSRGRGLNLAAAEAGCDSLLLCDADLLVTPAAIEEGLCALAKGAAWFPVIRYLAGDGSMAAAGVDGYGIAFMKRGLLRAAGGVPEFRSWGGEDNLLHQRVSQLAPVRRSATNGILHQWHPEEIRDQYYENRRRSDYERHDPEAAPQVPACIAALPETIRILHATHPHWSGHIHLMEDGRFLRPGYDGGTYEHEDGGLTLHWDHWPPETFQRSSEDRTFTFREIRLWQPAPPRILIGICSCRGYADKRGAVRGTWLSDLPANVSARFFVGTGAHPVEDAADLRVVDAPDDYDHLPAKVLAFFKEALRTSDFEWLYKCDDDTYLVPDRLSELIDGAHDFIGNEFLAERGSPSGGAGYLVSREYIRRLCEEASLPVTGAEDVILGEALIALGARPLATTRLCWNHSRRPLPDNDLVSCHWCSPERMEALHAFLRSAPARVYHVQHRSWEDELWCHSGGLFMKAAGGCCGRWHEAENGDLHLRWFQWPEEIVPRTGPRTHGNDVMSVRLVGSTDDAAGKLQPLDLRSFPVVVTSGWKFAERRERLRRLLEHHGFQPPAFLTSELREARGTCYASITLNHLAAITRQPAPFLLLEDDAWPTEWFAGETTCPADADALWLGITSYGMRAGAPAPDAAEFSGDAAVPRVANMLGTHAILFLTQEFANAVRDELLATLRHHPDHPHDRVMAELQRSWKIHAVNPPLLYQDDGHLCVTNSPVIVP